MKPALTPAAILALTAAVLSLASVPTAAAPVPKGAESANLVLNGSFEDPHGSPGFGGVEQTIPPGPARSTR